ncbi:MAG: hypothetical protein ABF288_07455 [Octadecabacter sp.]
MQQEEHLAFGTGLGSGKAARERLAMCHVERSHIPTLVEGAAVSGRLRADLVAELGVPHVVVAGGAGYVTPDGRDFGHDRCVELGMHGISMPIQF